MELRALQIPAALVVIGIATCVSGAACIQPEDTFDDFGERLADVDQGPQSVAVSTGLIEGCVPPGPDSAVAGTYIFALAVQLAPTKPIYFKAEVSFGDPEKEPSLSMKLTPLKSPYLARIKDPFAEIPPAIEIGPIPLDAEGKFKTDLPELTVSGDANSVTGAEIVATISIDAGQICEVNEGQAPAIVCGNVSGDVSKPITYELDPAKNFYAMTKYEGEIPNDPTQIVLNCALEKGQEP